MTAVTCSHCGKDSLSSLERSYRVHEYCRSYQRRPRPQSTTSSPSSVVG